MLKAIVRPSLRSRIFERALVFTVAVGGFLPFASVAQSIELRSAVGFDNIAIDQGFQMIAHPFQTDDHSIGALLTNVPEGTVVYKVAEDGSESNLDRSRDRAFMRIATRLPQVEANGSSTNGTSTNAGTIAIRTEGGDVILEWTGTLEAADQVTGPYQAVADATSPLELTPDQPQRFWRVEGGGGTSPGTSPEPTAFIASAFQDGAWSDPSMTLNPGEGAVLFNPTTNSTTLTFSGTVLEGELSNPVPAGLSIRSDLLPKSGGITTVHELELQPGDRVLRLKGNLLEGFAIDENGDWAPEEPEIGATESFFIFTESGAQWTQTFQFE